MGLGWSDTSERGLNESWSQDSRGGVAGGAGFVFAGELPDPGCDGESALPAWAKSRLERHPTPLWDRGPAALDDCEDADRIGGVGGGAAACARSRAAGRPRGRPEFRSISAPGECGDQAAERRGIE